MSARVRVRRQPSTSRALVLLATKQGASPSRRSPSSTGKGLFVVRRMVSISSVTVVPVPVPRLKAVVSPPASRYFSARTWASARSRT